VTELIQPQPVDFTLAQKHDRSIDAALKAITPAPRPKAPSFEATKFSSQLTWKDYFENLSARFAREQRWSEQKWCATIAKCISKVLVRPGGQRVQHAIASMESLGCHHTHQSYAPPYPGSEMLSIKDGLRHLQTQLLDSPLDHRGSRSGFVAVTKALKRLQESLLPK
jgi:hypothetical protein